jgi:hypothetical protein
MSAFLEFEQRCAHLHALSRLDQQLGDVARLRRGHFHNRLFGLDRDQWLIDDDVVAFGDVPTDNLGLLQPFTKIRQGERAHA